MTLGCHSEIVANFHDYLSQSAKQSSPALSARIVWMEIQRINKSGHQKVKYASIRIIGFVELRISWAKTHDISMINYLIEKKILGVNQKWEKRRRRRNVNLFRMWAEQFYIHIHFRLTCCTFSHHWKDSNKIIYFSFLYFSNSVPFSTSFIPIVKFIVVIFESNLVVNQLSPNEEHIIHQANFFFLLKIN